MNDHIDRIDIGATLASARIYLGQGEYSCTFDTIGIAGILARSKIAASSFLQHKDQRNIQDMAFKMRFLTAKIII